MKNHFFLAAVASLLTLAASCQKTETVIQNKTEEGEANVKVRINTAALTKAADPDESINVIEVYVYDNNPESLTNGQIEAYKKFTGEEIPEDGVELDLTMSVGLKHFYVVINGPEASVYARRNETTLTDYYSLITENTASNLVMVGGGAANLEAGSNTEISLTCRRLVSKISVGNIYADFESPALKNYSIRIDKVFLMNVPRRVKLINGNVNDVFGTRDTYTAYSEGDNGYPQGFVPALKDGEPLLYYNFITPVRYSGFPNGYSNFYDSSTFQETKVITIEDDTKALTCMDINQAIYPSPANTTVSVNRAFYTCPNPERRATQKNAVDYTTRFVVEATAMIGGAQKTYYSISIPYTQPNYYYQIESITLKGLGVTDPTMHVERSSCEFTMSIRDWETGKIVGLFNNETDEGVFVF